MLESLQCEYTFVRGNYWVYAEHFGKCEHDYDYEHWLDLPLEQGMFDIAQFLIWHPAAAAEHERDAAPLRSSRGSHLTSLCSSRV